MDSGKANRWLTLIANIGVLIGLALLIVELQQTREATRAGTRSNLAEEISSLLSGIAMDADMADIRLRGDAGEELTRLESYRYDLIQRSLFRYWENNHYQYRMGLYDESEFIAHKMVWGRYVNSSKRLPGYWCSIRGITSEGFAREMDSVIIESPCGDR